MSETAIQPVQPASATMNTAPVVFAACSTIYVKNLNYRTTQQTLTRIFGAFGPIKNITIKNKENTNGHAMMFSFITYETEDQATAALNAMNGKTVEGRTLTVKYGKPLGSEEREHKPSIKVSNVHFRIRNEGLRKIFEKYNPLRVEIKLVNKNGKIQSSGVGIIELPSVEMQELAINEMNNTDHEGRTITVEKVHEKKAENAENTKTESGNEKVEKAENAEKTEKVETEKKDEKKEEKKEEEKPKAGGKTPSKTKVIVQNLHYRIRDEALRRMFAKYKPKAATVNVEKLKNGRVKSKEFGFVEFESEEMQQLAICEMNNTEHDGKYIVVKPAFERVVIAPEKVVYPIPLKSYYCNETVTLEIRGQQYKVTLKPDVKPGKQFKVEDAGMPLNGAKRDLIIELGEEESETFRREGDDLYHTVIYSKQYKDQTHQLELTLIDGTPYKTKALVKDDQVIHLMRYGFKMVSGLRGDYYIVIKLQ